MTKIPSRVLNEKMNFLSLSVIDIATLGYVLIISNGVLSIFGLELFSFVILGITTSGLISIRLKFRPKSIRDYLSFLASKRISRSREVLS